MRTAIAAAVVAPLLLGMKCRQETRPTPPVTAHPGFATPAAITKANEKSGGVWSEIGDADWSCLGTPTADQPSTQTIMLSGIVEDFQTGDPVGDATLTALPGAQLARNLGMATSSNVAATRGQYAMNLAALPAGETRFGLKLEAAGYLKTYQLNLYLDPADSTQAHDLVAWSELTANALPAFIGVTRDPADAMVFGMVRDCAGRPVSNAVATVSSTSGMVNHLPDTSSYYFSAGGTSLPVRTNQSPALNKDGVFVILGAHPQSAPAFVQVWGFTTEAQRAAGTLTLLAEQPTPLEANAVIEIALEPLRTR